MRRFLFSVLAIWSALFAPAANAASLPERVQFQSLDGKTALVGYLFRPAGKSAGGVPAVVMMHGRAGAYSTLANGRYESATLSKRHATWGALWAHGGYLALLVDGFGPRGYPAGFPIHSYDSRPAELDEVNVRPLDAFGALKYLRGLPGVDGRKIILQGWSNGGSATLAGLSEEALASAGLGRAEGFRGGIAFYPACGLHNQFAGGYRPYAPVRVFAGDNDEEVSAARCARLINAAAAKGADASITVYPGATHDFDDPGAKRQGVPENAAAVEKAVPSALDFARSVLSR